MSEWRDIPSFPNYQASDDGEIRNKRRGNILKPSSDRYGYLKMSLGTVDNVPVHRLICETFHGPAKNDKYQVNHLDCDRKNNKASNLEWCSNSENVRWGVKHGNIDPMLGLDKAIENNKKTVKIIELNKTFSSVKECAAYLRVPATHVSRCLTGSRKGQKLHGYKLEYVGKECL